MIINDIQCTFPAEISLEEATKYVNDEIAIWAAKGKRISSIDLELKCGEVWIPTKELSPIVRYRRITGYIVPTTCMADHKQAEVKERVNHGIS